jgi:small subunit ribosomal protein S5
MSYQQRGRRGQRGDSRGFREEVESEFKEEVVHINRVAKVVKGGRKFHFTALVVVGDGKSRVGLGYGKAGEVVDAIRKGVEEAKREMVTLVKVGTTIPYVLKNHYCSSTVILKPAQKGHGIIAGGSARPILALGGVEDVTAKFIGSNNHVNCARATFYALKGIQSADHIHRLRAGEKVDSLGRFVKDIEKQASEKAIEEFTAEEEAAKRETENRLSGSKAGEGKAQEPSRDEGKAKEKTQAPSAATDIAGDIPAETTGEGKE